MIEHRAISPPFSIDFTSADNFASFNYGKELIGLIDPMLSDGYWLMLEPLGLRIEEAKRRLSESEESVTDVALAAGFSHSQHFSTAFRTATGMTPSTFRRQHLS